MNNKQLINLAALLLLLFAGVMIYLGIANSILPPTITGAGFIVIAITFLGLKRNL